MVWGTRQGLAGLRGAFLHYVKENRVLVLIE